MKEPGPALTVEDDSTRSIFFSYATSDRKKALNLCNAIERRGVNCWIAARDVAPGENYQEAIVRSIRASHAMVLLFSSAANKSDEIKKELSLASRYRVPVIAFRIENVEPSDAFAYELSTRQWIDAFSGWDKATDVLVGRISEISGVERLASSASSSAIRKPAKVSRRAMLAGAFIGLLLLAAAAIWWQTRLSPAAKHGMTVRLAGFELLSEDLPATLRAALDAEIAAAFNADGVVGVSTASGPAAGSAPAYALGGTIQRDGASVRVITRLTDERSGTTLWTDKFDYARDEIDKVPRHIAVDAGNVVRCGLFGASTYDKPLPDPVLKDYMQFCQGHWDPSLRDGRKALVPAQRVVAAVPDFSWGWAAVAGGYWKVAMTAADKRLADQAREAGRQAADRALAIDSRNSEAMWIKSRLLDRYDWTGREELLKRAIDVRSLDCGCEHHQYGELLLNFGRVAEAVEQLRQANDMLALYVYTAFSLAEALIVAERADEAKAQFDAAIELAPNSTFADWIKEAKAVDTGDIAALEDPSLPLSPNYREAMLKGYRALASGGNSTGKEQAVEALLALPEGEQDYSVARLLGSLGANDEAFAVARRIATKERGEPSVFWFRSMRATLNNPGFPELMRQLGLMSYWKTTRTRPDVCSEQAAPPFCRMI